MDEAGFLIKPQAITIDNHWNDKLENEHVILESIPINAYTVPLKTLPKQLFEPQNILSMMLTHTQKLLKNNGDLIRNFIKSDK